MSTERQLAAVPTPDTALARREVLLWDDAIHEHHEACLLYFWRLSFGVYFDRELILGRLHELYAHFEIPSYSMYQVLGDYDLLLRLWIPRRFIPEEIDAAFDEFLAGTSLEQSDFIACHTRTHWAKRDKNGVPNDQIPDVDSVGEDLIAAVNEFNRNQFDDGTAVPRPPGTEELIENDILSPISLETKGVRMFVLFDRARRAGPNYHEDVVARLMRARKDIESNWAEIRPSTEDAPWPTGPHFSLYSGHGSMSDFLLMLRAPHGEFHAFVTLVISHLRSLGLEKTYQIRPYTYVLADNLFTEFREQRISIGGADITTSTLNGRETDTLEFKATLAVNLRRWRNDRSLTGADRADDRMKDGVVKSVCGFLNSLEGGTLIIGVLETEHEYVAAEGKSGGTALLAWLSETFGYVADTDADGHVLRPLRNALLGIEHEYGEDGPYDDAEQYEAALRDILKTRIDPNPLRWLRVGEREIDSKTFAVVTVRPADTWCYANISTSREPQFFVREAASTRAATGREAELYRDADPRGTGHRRRERM
jgi:hypothetical protein